MYVLSGIILQKGDCVIRFKPGIDDLYMTYKLNYSKIWRLWL